MEWLFRGLQVVSWILVLIIAYDVVSYARRTILRRADRAFIHAASHAIRAFVEWHGIYMAYGVKSFYVISLTALIFHVSFLGLLLYHAPCIASTMCFGRPAPPVSGPAQTVLGALALCCRLVALTWKFAHAEVRRSLRAVLKVEGLRAVAPVAAFEISIIATLALGLAWRIIGIKMHLWACMVCLAVVALSPSVRHSLAYAWLRPLVVAVKALRRGHGHWWPRTHSLSP